MRTPRCITTALLAILVIGAEAQARSGSRPPTRAAARGERVLIPAEWAGIWLVSDTTFNCGIPRDSWLNTRLDTLCADASFDRLFGVTFQNCGNGVATSTTIDMSCSSSLVFGGCTISSEFTVTGTRTGDTADLHKRYNRFTSPPWCSQMDCQERVTRMTRIAPEPPTCLTSTRAPTWGQLKTRYR